MVKRLILIHGRHFKPRQRALEKSWFDALQWGLSRDYGQRKVNQFEKIDKDLVYYGDFSNDKLREFGERYDAKHDLSDRKKALSGLKQYSRDDFMLDKGKDHYHQLPAKTSIKESLADIFAYPLHKINASEYLIKKVAPDMKEYWNSDSTFGSEVRWTLTEPLKNAFENRDDVMLISHSLGTMISYDVLWKFSHYAEHKSIRNRNLSHWITLGSPLGNETVKENLKGNGAKGIRRYPSNIRRWTNVAAEDDYISHDQTLSDDYVEMHRHSLIESINDHRIYNLAVRNGKSNPHHGTGYLIHPVVIDALADWMSS